MRKLLRGASVAILLCLIGGAIFLFILASEASDTMAAEISKRLQTKVQINDLKWTLSSLTVNGFEIDNPRGYDLPKALSSSQIVIHAPLTHYLKDHIEIDEITADTVYIGLEFDSPQSTRGNWSTLLAQAQRSQAERAPHQEAKTVFIKRLVLNHIQAELYYQSDKKIRKLKPIRQIELLNISSQGGDIEDQLLNSALGQAVKQIFIHENLKDVLDELLQSPANPIKDYLDPLRNFFNVAPEEKCSETVAPKIVAKVL